MSQLAHDFHAFGAEEKRVLIGMLGAGSNIAHRIQVLGFHQVAFSDIQPHAGFFGMSGNDTGYKIAVLQSNPF